MANRFITVVIESQLYQPTGSVLLAPLLLLLLRLLLQHYNTTDGHVLLLTLLPFDYFIVALQLKFDLLSCCACRIEDLA